MLALTFTQLFWWAVIIIGSIVVLVLFLWGLATSVTRWGRRWTYSWVLVVAVGVAAAVVFPLHHGDGRSTSYNDGWDFVAASTAGSFQSIYGSQTCLELFAGEASAGAGGVFAKADVTRKWVLGCRDARAAMRRAEQSATIPVKTPR